jgi:hypothetical protein
LLRTHRAGDGRVRRIETATAPEGRDERGVVLLVAIAVTFVVILMSLAAVNQSVHGITQSGIANTQVQSIDAAEAGIQFEVNALAADQTTFTCPSAANSTLTTGDYYTLYDTISSTAPARTAPLPTSCASVTLTSSPSYILLRSIGTSAHSGFGNRSVEALLAVTPAPTGGVLADALYGGTGVGFQNSGTITAASGVATIYAGTGASYLPCSSSGGTVSTTGNILSTDTGTWTLTNGCTIGGNVWSSGPIEIKSSSPSIAGTVETPGTITVDNPPNSAIGGADAGGTITVPVGGQATRVPPNCPASIFLKCVADDASVVAPSAEALPSISSSNFPSAIPPTTAAPWTTTTVTSSNCGSAATTVGTEATVGSGSQLVVLPANCQLTGNGGSINVTNNLAVIMPGGLNFTNGVSITSSGNYKIYLIVPTGSTSSISFDGPSFGANLTFLMYTPGNVTFSNFNSTGLHGQIYGGGYVYSNSGLNLVYVPVTVSGLGGGGGAGTEALAWEYRSS